MVFYLDDDVLDCFTQLYSYELVAVFHFFKFFSILVAELRDLVDDLVKSVITALAESHQFEKYCFQGFLLRDDCFDFSIDFVEISAELMQVRFELLYLFLLGSVHFQELLYLLGLVDCLSIGCDALELRVKAVY